MHGDNLSAFLDRLPPELGEREQQVADAAGLVVAGRAVIASMIYQLFVLSADAPAFGQLLAVDHRRDQLLAALDDRVFGARRLAGAHAGCVRKPIPPAPAICSNRRQFPSIER